MRFVMSIALLCVVMAGCSSDTAPSPTSIDGAWSQDFSVPGSFLTMQLKSYGTDVAGTGTYCGEAGPCGTLEVAGTIKGNAVHLDLMLTQQQPTFGVTTAEHFDGAFSGLYTLLGTLTSASGSGAETVTFRHPVVGPI